MDERKIMIKNLVSEMIDKINPPTKKEVTIEEIISNFKQEMGEYTNTHNLDKEEKLLSRK